MDKGPLPSHLREIGIPEWGNGGHGHPLAWWETREYAVYLRTRARTLAECKAAVEEARRAAYSDAVNEVNKEFSAGPIDWRLGTADNVSKVELAFYTRLLEIRDWLEARAEGRGE